MKRIIFIFLLISFRSWPSLNTSKGYFLKWQFKNSQFLYEKELEKTRNPAILFNLAICFQKQGNLLSFKNIKTDYPNLRDGLFYYYNGEYNKALNSFKEDKTLYSYIGMGMVKKAKGDFKGAERLFKKACPTPLGYINLCDLYLILGREKSFLSILESGIKKTHDDELLFRFAMYLNDKKRDNEALNILKMLKEKEPENILVKEEVLKTLIYLGKEEDEIFSIIQPTEIERLYLTGCFCAFTQAYLRAFREFEACYEKEPDFTLAKMRALWMAKEIGWRAKAESLYKEISKALPGDGLCNVYLAEAYTKMGSLTLAFKYAKNALKKEPNLERAHFALGNVYYLKSDFIRAILSYKNGINLSSSKKYFYLFLESAFVLRFLPIFLSGYLILWLITILVLLLINTTGMFLIKPYPSLKRYAVKKRYLLYFYPLTTAIFLLSLIFGERMIRFVPIELLKDSFISLAIYLPAGIISILILSLILGKIIKWPKLRIYLSFILLDISLDIAIIVLISSLIPFFADYPQVFSVVSIIVVVLFRRLRFFIACLILLFFHIGFSLYVLSGYKKVEKDELFKADKIFKKAISSLWFIKWLEPTYSDMASTCILGGVFIAIKRNEFEKIEMLWSPLLKSLENWWPLNTRARFLYNWSIILSLILQEKKDLAKERLKSIIEIPEYKNKGGISFLYKLLGEEFYEKKKPERYLSFIISYLYRKAIGFKKI